MNRNTAIRSIGMAVAMVAVAGIAVTNIGCGKTTATPGTTTTPAAKVTSSDPQDIVPGLYKNPITNTATAVGFKITAIKVENNVDANGKDTDDHLELKIKNTAKTDLADFEAYYTIADKAAKKVEGYYKKLTGLTLKSGAETSINFDNTKGDGHFGANPDSLLYQSKNKLQLDVQVSSPGYKIQSIQVKKDAGGAESSSE